MAEETETPISDRLPGHECNALCRHPVHAESCWSVSRPYPSPSDWQARYGELGARVLSVTPAEMPPLALPDGRIALYRYLVMVEVMPPPPGPYWYSPVALKSAEGQPGS